MVGDVRFTLDLGRLTFVERAVAPEKPKSSWNVNYTLGPILPTTELHIRGKRAEDAMIEVEEFLDKALRDGISTVRIVHGKGRGILQQGVHDLLDRNSLVKSYGFADRRDGGVGVTVVELT